MFSACSIPLKYVDWKSVRDLRHPYEIFVEPENKLVQVQPLRFLSAFEQDYLREGKMSLKLLNEEIGSNYIAYPMKPFSPFYEEVKKNIQALLANGRLEEQTKTKYNTNHFKYQHDTINDSVPALVLSLDDLGIGFMICLIPLTLSLVAFVSELAVPRVKALAIKTRDLLTFLYVIRAIANLK